MTNGSRNEVSDANQIEHLALCGSLRTLTLEGNPIEYIPNLESKNVPDESRLIISEILPQLTVLDDAPIRLQERTSELS